MAQEQELSLAGLGFVRMTRIIGWALAKSYK
jgi:hypothetical protein